MSNNPPSFRKRILIIGTGSIGKRHLRCYQNTGRANVADVICTPAHTHFATLEETGQALRGSIAALGSARTRKEVAL